MADASSQTNTMGSKVIARGNMRKTTIELTDEQYFFLKEKALELQKQNRSASIVSIIRDLIDKDRREWTRGKKKGG